MQEISIVIDRNRFLMNKIRLLLTKKSRSDQRDPDLHLLSLFQYCHILYESK